ncbi:hypothetical protein ACP275_06G111000 [Erythranthe tilingii]
MRMIGNVITFLFIIFIVVSSQVRLSGSRLINDSANDEERIRAKFDSTFRKYFSTVTRYSTKKNEGKKLRAVSRRAVPSGPNPLHN